MIEINTPQHYLVLDSTGSATSTLTIANPDVVPVTIRFANFRVQGNADPTEPRRETLIVLPPGELRVFKIILKIVSCRAAQVNQRHPIPNTLEHTFDVASRRPGCEEIDTKIYCLIVMTRPLRSPFTVTTELKSQIRISN